MGRITPNSFSSNKLLNYYTLRNSVTDTYLPVNFIQAVIHQLHGVGVREQLIACNKNIIFKICEGWGLGWVCPVSFIISCFATDNFRGKNKGKDTGSSQLRY